MDAFSYLSVLLSVILGLAITQVLQGYRALALNRRRVTLYWPSLAWSAMVLLMVAQHWWASFDLTTRADWSFADFAAILIQTALIYMLAALVLPDMPADQPLDLKAHYERERVAFFGVASGVIAWSIVRELILQGRLPEPDNLAFHLVFLILALIAAWSRSERLHKALTATMALLFTAYTAALFARLS